MELAHGRHSLETREKCKEGHTHSNTNSIIVGHTTSNVNAKYSKLTTEAHPSAAALCCSKPAIAAAMEPVSDVIQMLGLIRVISTTQWVGVTSSAGIVVQLFKIRARRNVSVQQHRWDPVGVIFMSAFEIEVSIPGSHCASRATST